MSFANVLVVHLKVDLEISSPRCRVFRPVEPPLLVIHLLPFPPNLSTQMNYKFGDESDEFRSN